MQYSINENQISLLDIMERIKRTDLTPSISPIKEEIDTIFTVLANQNITNLSDLRKSLKNKDSINILSSNTNIDAEYLNLLRREIEGWIPKKIHLKEFSWVNEKILSELNKEEITTTEDYYISYKTNIKIIETLVNDKDTIEYLYRLCTISRIRWVSPSVARIFVELGYDTIDKLAEENGERLSERFDECNQHKKYFNGKVGLRDIKRVINEAKNLL